MRVGVNSRPNRLRPDKKIKNYADESLFRLIGIKRDHQQCCVPTIGQWSLL